MSDRIGRVTEAQVRRELLREADRAGRRRTRIGAAAVLAVALILSALASRFMASLVLIRTNAMGDALKCGDVALCARADMPIPALCRSAERGTLALVRYSENGLHRQAVRRIIALPGDEVSVAADGRVTLNGELLDEPYALWRAVAAPEERQPGGAIENPFVEPETQHAHAGLHPAETETEYPLTVPEGKLFVLCDDREELLDSRIGRFGLVEEKDVLGWPLYVLWPAHRAGTRLAGPE